MGINFKKSLAVSLLSVFLCSNLAYSAPMSGHIQKDDHNQQELNKELFTGEVEKLDSNDVIKLTVTGHSEALQKIS